MNSIELRQINRPHIDKLSDELKRFAQSNWDDASVLAQILTELLFRKRRFAVKLRGEVVDRLIELQRQSFPWPSTVANLGSGKLSDINWPKEGLLSFMGYKTGQNGASEEARRSILDYVYTQDVPNVNSAKYMTKWGKPNTGNRLSKMAESIAAFVRNAKRRDDRLLSISIAEWEADLDYLKAQYYIGRYNFIWPLTNVRN